MPIRSGDDCLTSSEAIGERAAGDLRFVNIRSDVNVGCPNEFSELFNIDKAVEENDVLAYPIVTGDALEAKAIGFSFVSNKTRMCCAENNVNNLGEFGPQSPAGR